MRDRLQESDAIDLLFVPVPGKEVFSFDQRDLHNVADVEVLRPFRLIKETEDVPHVCFALTVCIEHIVLSLY